MMAGCYACLRPCYICKPLPECFCLLPVQERADEIVQQHVNPRQPVASWHWEDLLNSIK